MSLSKELQIGKAGEHLVCCDLITQGYNAFLADQGLPYDVLVDIKGKIYRIQVKTCTKKSTYGKNKDVYRFSLRSSKGSIRAIESIKIDCVAFVFINMKKVEYLGRHLLTTELGYLKQCIDFKEKGDTKYVIGKYSKF